MIPEISTVSPQVFEQWLRCNPTARLDGHYHSLIGPYFKSEHQRYIKNGQPLTMTLKRCKNDREIPTTSLTHVNYKISLFYCYVEIDKVNEQVVIQNELCKHLSLFGRIRVSTEGLNGVLSGLETNLLLYQQKTQTHLGLEVMDVKYCSLRIDLSVEAQLFTSLSIRKTKEVVTLFEPTTIDKIQCDNAISKQFYRRRRRNRTKCEQRSEAPISFEQQSSSAAPQSAIRLDEFSPALHLKPQEWNQRLLSHHKDAIIVDARNVYESRVGHFKVEGIPTLLTNTRKYTSLTEVLLQSKEHLAGKSVYMFCTGGVRCERASVYLQALSRSEEWNGLDAPKAIYQLEGGIQRYLETFGSTGTEQEECLYRGKNFVFDQRRTDPCTGNGIVGNCLICCKLWDDYDNGNAPVDNTEGRCCKCRILLLVCNDCRSVVRSCGEQENGKTDLYCGIKDCFNEGNGVNQAEILME